MFADSTLRRVVWLNAVIPYGSSWKLLLIPAREHDYRFDSSLGRSAHCSDTL